MKKIPPDTALFMSARWTWRKINGKKRRGLLVTVRLPSGELNKNWYRELPD